MPDAIRTVWDPVACKHDQGTHPSYCNAAAVAGAMLATDPVSATVAGAMFATDPVSATVAGAMLATDPVSAAVTATVTVAVAVAVGSLQAQPVPPWTLHTT